MYNSVNVVFTIDQKFLQHFSVAIVSLLENNRDLSFNIYVIHDIENRERLSQDIAFIEQRYGIKITLIYLDNSIFEHFRVSLHYSKAVYFRLLFPEILPKDIDKALFLDSDLVVTGSLKELVEYEFEPGEYLLAVDDAEVGSHIERLNDMGFPVKRYFNAGVMFINLKAWRDDNVSEKFIEMANKYMDQLAWWDQDILNMYFYDGWKYMDNKYNAIHLRKKLNKVPVIVHYAGPSKPWLYIHDHPYKSLYWKYIKNTPYGDAKYMDFTFKEFLRKYYIRVLDTLKLREPAISKNS